MKGEEVLPLNINRVETGFPEDMTTIPHERLS
jgi:hypothetical protein